MEIIEINNDQSLEFKNNDGIEKIVSECNTFLKGKKVRDTFKSGSGKILDTGIKVKEGIQKGLKSGTGNLTESVSKETNLILEEDKSDIYTEVSGEVFLQNIKIKESVDAQGAI